MRTERSEVSEATRKAEAADAEARHGAERPVTDEDEQSGEDRSVDPDVRAHYQEMVELGAEEVGEGRIP
jgi:hypothetical protein